MSLTWPRKPGFQYKNKMPTFAALKIEAVKAFGDFGAWAFDEWKRLNDALFYCKNIAGAIIWKETPKDSSLGYYDRTENLIVLHKTLMRPIYPTPGLNWKLRHLNARMVSDVLLHEMIHQRVHQTGGWMGEDSHNNERFVNEVNRIANLLRLNIKAKVIRSPEIPGQAKTIQSKTIPFVESECLSFKELSHFPYLSRSRNYYYEQS
jgi:hypothetical protein